MNNSYLRPSINTIEAFRRQHGRPLRVLHIGNVANNAYQNAKLLNALGAECDVVCRDYYHIMACPEWEDADFPRQELDELRPDWATMNLNGYKRPRWFVQGFETFCLDYLLARRSQSRLESKYWLFLSLCNRTTKFEAAGVINRIERRLRIAFDISGRRLNKMLLEPPTILLKRIQIRLGMKGVDFTNGRGRLLYIGLATLIFATAATFRLLLAPYLLLRLLNRLAQRSQLDNMVAKLGSTFRKNFPERTDRFSLKDIQFQSLNHQLSKWAELFTHYDLVHAYATDGIYPMLAGKSFLAFEHGTLRDIPFEPTPQGRCCALSYHCADYVLITNADNRDAAQKLAIREFGFIPHMVNESFLPDSKGKEELFEKLHEDLESPFIVFHPPRHHWSVETRLEGDKGNDIFLTGFAKFIKDREPKAKVLLVKWGTTVEQSISLIERLGITPNVRWIMAQPHREMIRFICGCDLVADQFVLGAFGNIMPQALFCGRPAMLFLNEAKHAWCFDTMPPVINAKDPEEVYAGLCKVYEDKAFVNDLVTQGHNWYSKYHSNNRIGDILQSAYANVLSDSPLALCAFSNGLTASNQVCNRL